MEGQGVPALGRELAHLVVGVGRCGVGGLAVGQDGLGHRALGVEGHGLHIAGAVVDAQACLVDGRGLLAAQVVEHAFKLLAAVQRNRFFGDGGALHAAQRGVERVAAGADGLDGAVQRLPHLGGGGGVIHLQACRGGHGLRRVEGHAVHAGDVARSAPELAEHMGAAGIDVVAAVPALEGGAAVAGFGCGRLVAGGQQVGHHHLGHEVAVLEQLALDGLQRDLAVAEHFRNLCQTGAGAWPRQAGVAHQGRDALKLLAGVGVDKAVVAVVHPVCAEGHRHAAYGDEPRHGRCPVSAPIAVGA